MKKNKRRKKTYKNEIRNGFDRVIALLGVERLDSEVAAVAGESNSETESICRVDRFHSPAVDMFRESNVLKGALVIGFDSKAFSRILSRVRKVKFSRVPLCIERAVLVERNLELLKVRFGTA